VRSSEPVDLAIVPIGAYNPWAAVHCNPEEAVVIGDDCGAGALLPVHHQTFELSREPYYEPIERFVNAARGRVALSEIGAEWSASALSAETAQPPEPLPAC
jgi:L-ascorbate metabolism protein UlaG (beta-lactamase superfamily)